MFMEKVQEGMKFWQASLLNKGIVVCAFLVFCAGSTLVSSKTGILSLFVPLEADRLGIEEACQQLVTAIMTIPTVAILPETFEFTYLYFADQKRFEDALSKSGLYREQMQIILILKNINILTHFVVCYAMWAFGPVTRPMILIVTCLPTTILSGVGHGVYEDLSKKQALERGGAPIL
ncbi:hypothetical protein CYMTET_33839 [Cymbomonas tetramitiformis]|uniref:Uncharacterized protein n=1 Tax=Cymbomonas tetramitiformis TaxID=36881 RepID=A0AAE0KQT0_9CHLO|nr:hypothetical protein CYMTET_33839 [Cymbomonas tetramitiformis]|eukprot:gene3455-4340_t